MFKRVIPLLLALTLMLGLGAYWLLYYTGNNTEFAKGHRYLVTIKPGMTTADIADLLHKKHLVKTPEAFRMEARLRGLAGKLEAGRYEIVGGMSNSEIVSILSKGQTYNVKFTVPEGFNVVKRPGIILRIPIWKQKIRMSFSKQKGLFFLLPINWIRI